MTNPERIGVLGASGLTGSILVELLAKNFPEATIHPIGRRVLPIWRKWPNVRPVVLPKLDLEADYEQIFQLDVLCSCLGSTMAKAGSKADFFTIDYTVPAKMFQVAKSQGLEHLILMSSFGADAKSKSFYLQTKGKLEESALALKFPSTHILRPSLLLGARKEWRTMEWLGQKLLGALHTFLPLSIRPISAQLVAQKMVDLIKSPSPKQWITNADLHTQGNNNV